MQRSSPSPAIGPVDAIDRGRRAVAAASNPPAAGDDVSTVLDRVGAELAALHATVLHLQDALGPTLAAAAGDGRVLRSAQELDLVAQTLDGLSVFLGAVSRGDLRPGRLDTIGAASAVALDGLSSRLIGRSSPRIREDRCDEDRRDDVELF